ncbi:glycosyltransferase family 4 protein [Gordonia sp. NB41Y]|uniref:glycosyltransferase family 4 protein n=1 Tax=Gordonia sp. NB41Y TaxID=875808 RepID=UPI001364DD69|nr:glycosyltransferase family 4 protein [Gordonia sp. NB41Y]WLP92122.1 glycosyltransferase family 4 protein [Gordonia sp. NB41Y]
MIKVAHLSHSLEIGGAELALRRVLENSRLLWRPFLFVPASNATGDPFSGMGSDIRVVKCGPTQAPGGSKSIFLGLALLWNAVRMAMALRGSAEFRDADVVFANTTRASVYGRIAVLFARSRVFGVHMRDTCTRDSMGRFGFAIFSRFVLPRADFVISNSRYTERSVLPFIRSSCKSTVVPSPSGVPRVPAAPEVSSDVRRIGMVARLDDWKGQDLLLTAFADTGLAASGCVLLFAGAPAFGQQTWRDHLEEMVLELGLDGSVRFEGHVDDVTEFIDSLDICIQASTRPEPLGQNVLQYLSRGKPTVVADIGGPAEWVLDDVNGLTFAAGSSADLAAKLLRLSDGGLRYRLGYSARETAGLRTDLEVASEIGSQLVSVFLNSGASLEAS